MEALVPTSWPKQLYTGNLSEPSENHSLLITWGQTTGQKSSKFPLLASRFLGLDSKSKVGLLNGSLGFYGCPHIAHILAASLSKIHDTFGIGTLGRI